MTKNIFKVPRTFPRKTAALLCALFMLVPVPAAFAWTHVCLDFVFWKVWFDGKFQILYGFDEMPPLEGEVQAGGVYAYEHLTAYLYDGRSYDQYRRRRHNARDRTVWSPTLRAGKKHCASIAPIRAGEKFVVYLIPGPSVISSEEYGVFCYTKWTHAPRMDCLLYTSPSPRDATLSRMPSSA